MKTPPDRPQADRVLSRPERVAFGWGMRAPAVPAVSRTGTDGEEHAGQDQGPAAEPAARSRLSSREGREGRDWAYLGMLAFTAIVFFRPQDIFPPLGHLHLAELSAIIGITAMINGRLRRNAPVLPMTPEVVGLLLFAGVMLLVVPFSIWPGGSLGMMTELYLKVVLIVLLMIGTLTAPARVERFAWLIVLASGYLGLHAAMDYARGLHMVENERVHGSVGGVFDNPNDLALNMVAFLPIALLFAARRHRPTGRIVAALAAVLMFATIVFTKSRGGFLGAVAMLLVMLVQGGKVRRGFGAAVIVAALVAVPLLPSSFWDRMGSITDDSGDVTGSAEARRTVMKEAWRTFLEFPLTGVGPGEFKDYNPPWRQQRSREAHDVWLQVASETGIVGASIFIWLVVRTCRNAFSSSRLLSRLRGRAAHANDRQVRHHAAAETSDLATMNLLAAAMSASIVGWMVCATFDSVAYTWTFYYVFGIATATRSIAQRLVASRRHDSAPSRRSVAA